MRRRNSDIAQGEVGTLKHPAGKHSSDLILVRARGHVCLWFDTSRASSTGDVAVEITPTIPPLFSGK